MATSTINKGYFKPIRRKIFQKCPEEKYFEPLDKKFSEYPKEEKMHENKVSLLFAEF